ncbi:MAG: hypothetical protein KDA70_21580, partial [Planctomycetaceae bacterium]|nr:hypothetical protein [Planctomycetaceae bacterium]
MVSRNIKESPHGTVRIELPSSHSEITPGLERAREVAAGRHIYRWLPSENMRSELPEDFELKFDCLTGPDNVRRFYPTTDSESLISWLFSGGLAILATNHGVKNELLGTYKMMFQLFQKLRKLNNHQQRNFQGIKDLYIKKSGRSETNKRSVLPDTLGMGSDSIDLPWGINKLKTKGEELAKAYGIQKPSMNQTIEYGLFAAAKKQPLHIEEPEEIKSLIRIALYNELNTGDCDPQTTDWIEGEILD